MRGGRNKFGPMYKRDRALKQQAVRQRQQMFTQMHCQMQMGQFNGMGGPPLPPGMSGLMPPHMDGMGYDGPHDIKPSLPMIGMHGGPPHNGGMPHHGHMPPSMMSPHHPVHHTNFTSMNQQENPITSNAGSASNAVAGLHSSQGPLGPPNSSGALMMPSMMNSHLGSGVSVGVHSPPLPHHHGGGGGDVMGAQHHHHHPHHQHHQAPPGPHPHHPQPHMHHPPAHVPLHPSQRQGGLHPMPPSPSDMLPPSSVNGSGSSSAHSHNNNNHSSNNHVVSPAHAHAHGPSNNSHSHPAGQSSPVTSADSASSVQVGASSGANLPVVVRTLTCSEPLEAEVEHKLASIAEMMLQQQESLQMQQNQQGLMGGGAAAGGSSEPEQSNRANLQLLCKLSDQALFLLVEWARSAAFFKDLKVCLIQRLLSSQSIIICIYIVNDTNIISCTVK